MDLTRPVTYRGLLLSGAEGGPGGNNPIEGIRLTRARYTNVSVHGYIEKKSLDDGMDASDVFIGTRQIQMQGEVFARTKARLFEYLDVLRLKFTPTDAHAEAPYKHGYLPLSFSQPTVHTTYWPSGFVDRVMHARPLGQPEYDIELSSISGEPMNGYVVPFSVGLECIDPRIYAPVQVEVALGGTGGSGTLTNRGNYHTPLNFVLRMTTAHPGEAKFQWSGLGSTFELILPGSPAPADRIIRLDSENKVVTMTVGDIELLRMDLVTFQAGTTYPRVPPTPEGASAAGYSWSCSGGLDGQSRMWFNEAWI
jgi:hypothetical protein